MRIKKTLTSNFKAKVVLEALQERESLLKLGRKHELHPTQISNCKNQFLSNVASVFEMGTPKDPDGTDKNELFKKVGLLQMKIDFLKKVLGK